MNQNFNQEDTKIFFRPGDVVTLRQDIPNKPIMVVIRKETTIFKDNYQNTQLRGIRCRWFTTQGELQEATYSTKDLIKV